MVCALLTTGVAVSAQIHQHLYWTTKFLTFSVWFTQQAAGWRFGVWITEIAVGHVLDFSLMHGSQASQSK